MQNTGEQPYKKLWTYKYSVIIYDLTVAFCNSHITSSGKFNKGNLAGKPDYRLADQMIQAARSGKQNIVEGSQALDTSIKICIKLTNIAKGSLEELLQDYEDILRNNNLQIYSKQDKKCIEVRKYFSELISKGDLSNLSELKIRIQKADLETSCNTMLTLCHQVTYLLYKQVKSLEEKHKKEGGYTEKLYKQRKIYRGY